MKNERLAKFCFTLFEVLEKGPQTKEGIRLVLRTEKGPKPIWCPKKRINLYRSVENGKPLTEALIPDWLAERAGFI